MNNIVQKNIKKLDKYLKNYKVIPPFKIFKYGPRFLPLYNCFGEEEQIFGDYEITISSYAVSLYTTFLVDPLVLRQKFKNIKHQINLSINSMIKSMKESLMDNLTLINKQISKLVAKFILENDWFPTHLLVGDQEYETLVFLQNEKLRQQHKKLLNKLTTYRGLKIIKVAPPNHICVVKLP